jgi:hypothetical protein
MVSEYDELYLMKNPFYLGNFDNSIREEENLLLEDSDIYNQERKSFYLVRAYLAKGMFDKAEGVIRIYQKSSKASKEDIERFSIIAINFIRMIKDGVNSLYALH